MNSIPLAEDRFCFGWTFAADGRLDVLAGDAAGEFAGDGEAGGDGLCFGVVLAGTGFAGADGAGDEFAFGAGGKEDAASEAFEGGCGDGEGAELDGDVEEEDGGWGAYRRAGCAELDGCFGGAEEDGILGARCGEVGDDLAGASEGCGELADGDDVGFGGGGAGLARAAGCGLWVGDSEEAVAFFEPAGDAPGGEVVAFAGLACDDGG